MQVYINQLKPIFQMENSNANKIGPTIKTNKIMDLNWNEWSVQKRPHWVW